MEAFLRKQARAVAVEQLKVVEQTMRLENQSLSLEATKEQLDNYICTELDPRVIWDKHS